MTRSLSVLISTYLEPQEVERIADVDARLRVMYEPDLLPVPRYRADHTGTPRELDDTGVRRWERLLADADIAFDFDWQAPERLRERSPNLKWVQATSAGVGAFMRRTGLDDTDLVVTTAAGVHAMPLAEFAVAGALHFIKGFDELRQRQGARVWRRHATRQLAGRTVTVVGLGGMGRQTVRHFHALGTQVIAVGRPGGSYDLPSGVTLSDTSRLADVLPQTDVLVLCCALTVETEGLIGRAEIRLLPKQAILVNISRGQVVDEVALVEALADKRIAGACLDVFATEPLPTDSPLWVMDNVVVSPHSASTVATENIDITTLFVDNIGRWLGGQPLRNRYRPELGY